MTTLLVAATEPELCGQPGLLCGVGPVEAAVSTARALAVDPPRGVLHVGVAGATGLEPGTLVVGTEALYKDIVAAIPVVARVLPDASLVAAARAALPDAQALPIVTSAAVSHKRVTVTFGDGHLVEAMEGFAVLRACAVAGVPALEVRAIANELGEENRALWEIPRALGALAAAIPGLLAALSE